MAKQRVETNKRIRTRRGGLTLVDVTLTIVIIGLLAAVGAPRFAHTLAGFNVEAGAQRIAADLKRARQHAKAKGAPQSVVFTIANHTYELPGMHGSDRPGQPYLVDLTQSPYTISLAAVNLGATGTDTTVIFDMYGRPDYAGSVVVTSGDKQRTLRIHGVSGMVSIDP